MSLADACEEYLRGEDGDNDVLLVAIAKELEDGSAQEAAQTLLQDRYEVLLVKLGWDLVTLFTPHLHPSHPHTLQLITRITQVCSPKEMCLALLEQMELVTSDHVFVYFLLLQSIQQVLLRLQLKRTIDSSLDSIRSLLYHHYPTIESEQAKSPRKKASQGEELGSSDHESDQEEMEMSNSISIAPDEGEREGEGRISDLHESVEAVVTVHQAATQTLDFLNPFLEELHSEYSSSKARDEDASQLSWSIRQQHCISMLMCLLGDPFISHDLSKVTPSSKPPHKQSRELAERIMASVTHCHCGARELLSWTERVYIHVSLIPSDLADSSSEHLTTAASSLSPLGLSCFAYLLMAEEIQLSYLPSVLNHSYLLHINILHVKILFERSEKGIISKGLALLEVVLHRVPLHSLSSHILEDRRYLDLAKLLTSLMVSCQYKKIREKCVPLLRRLINCFEAVGRHRLYRNLLHVVTHAGVRGLLVHDVKNEVDQALKAEGAPVCVDQPFLGARLMSLLSIVATASTEEELLPEMDRIMPVLNFLRYLLIRDRKEINRTGVWSDTLRSEVQDKLIVPLREMLVIARAHAKQELELKTQEGREGKRAREDGGASEGKQAPEETEEGPELSVEVMGETLPKLSHQEEIKMIHLAGYQFDMLDSVLVRVEELLDDRT